MMSGRLKDVGLFSFFYISFVLLPSFLVPSSSFFPLPTFYVGRVNPFPASLLLSTSALAYSSRQTGLKVAGPTGRFKRALLKKIHQAGGQVAVGDGDVGRVLRQCLWQWAYELTEREYEDAMRGLSD